MYYTLYIYKFEPNIGIHQINNLVMQYKETADIAVSHLAYMDAAERLKIISGMILFERGRRYEAGVTKNLYIKFIEYAADRYLAVAAAAGDKYSDAEIINMLGASGNNVYFLNMGGTVENSERFWQEAVKGFVISGKRDYRTKIRRDFGIPMPLGLKNIDRFNELLEREPGRLKTYMCGALARVMCVHGDMAGLIFEDINDLGRLTRIPVRCNERVGTKKGLSSLYDFLSEASRNDCIVYKDIARKTGIDLENCTMFAEYFVNVRDYEQYFKRMSVGKIYKMQPLEIGNVPLAVIFDMQGEEKSVYYEYDSGFFADINIEGFHEAVCKLVDSYIEDSFVEPEIMSLLHKKSDLKGKIYEVVVKCLKNLKLFEGYTDKEIERVAHGVEIRQGFCGQNIVERDAKCNELYILATGKIEVTGTDMEENVRPVCMLREKDIFGFECLTTDTRAKFTYSVNSDRCVYLTIKKEVIFEEGVNHPELIKTLFDEVNKRLYKFQLLWVLS